MNERIEEVVLFVVTQLMWVLPAAAIIGIVIILDNILLSGG